MLPTNLATTYPDDLSDPSVTLHHEHHDIIHAAINGLLPAVVKTAAEWRDADLVLKAGQLSIVSETGEVRAGDGSRTWGQLPSPYSAVAAKADRIDFLEGQVRDTGVNVKNPAYGAVGDGIADDRLALQSAVDAAATYGAAVFLPPGRYRLQGSVNLPSNIVVRGTSRTIIDMSALGASSAFQAVGTAGSAVSLTADAGEGSTTLTVASTSGLVAGDWIKVGSTTLSSTVTGQAIGEAVRIRSIAGRVLTLADPLSRSYRTAASAAVQRLTHKVNVQLENLQFEGVESLTSTNFQAIRFDTARNVRVLDCSFKWVHYIGIWLADTVFAKVAGCHFEDALGAGTAYGVACHWATQDVSVVACSSARVRHQVTCGGGTSRRGTSRRVTVSGCTAVESTDAAFDAHPGCDWFSVTGCHVIGGGQDGIIGQGRHSVFTGNTITGVARHGIFVQGNSIGGLQATVSGNAISRAAGRGIYILPDSIPAHQVWSGVTVANNNLTDITGAAIEIGRSAASTYAEGFTVTGNACRRIGSNGILIRGVRDVTLSGNQVHQAAATCAGIFISSCLDVTVSGNAVNGNGVSAQGIRFHAGSSQMACSFNRVRGCATGILQDVTSKASTFVGNNAAGCTRGYSLSGSGNSAANNL
jgi:hypothetical protein